MSTHYHHLLLVQQMYYLLCLEEVEDLCLIKSVIHMLLNLVSIHISTHSHLLLISYH